MAPGAQRGHLLRIVFSANAVSVSSAIVAGLALSFALYRIFARWVENNSSDAITLVAGTLLLAAVSAIACLFPALHASHIDPMAALRIDKGDLRKAVFD
jgi:ABC-type antimicrobial peptide transport system permease subunit